MQTSKIPFVLLSVLPLAVMAQSAPDQTPSAPPPAQKAAPAEAAEALASKQAELSTVVQQITNLQLQAEGNEEVQTAKTGFRETLRSEMVRAAPALEADIDRQAALVVELTSQSSAKESAEKSSGAETTADNAQTKLEEYRQLHEKLAPVERSVQTVPSVQKARGEYYDKLIAEMERIEPRTQELLAKHRELVAMIRELTAQAQSG